MPLLRRYKLFSIIHSPRGGLCMKRKMRTKAAFSTALRKKTSIWPEDMVRFDNDGVFLWRAREGRLTPITGGNYIFKNPGILSLSQMEHLATQTAELLGMLTGMTVIQITDPFDPHPAYRLE